MHALFGLHFFRKKVRMTKYCCVECLYQFCTCSYLNNYILHFCYSTHYGINNALFHGNYFGWWQRQQQIRVCNSKNCENNGFRIINHINFELQLEFFNFSVLNFNKILTLLEIRRRPNFPNANQVFARFIHGRPCALQSLHWYSKRWFLLNARRMTKAQIRTFINKHSSWLSLSITTTAQSAHIQCSINSNLMWIVNSPATLLSVCFLFCNEYGNL